MNKSVSEVLERLAPETDPTPDWDWVLSQAGLTGPESHGAVAVGGTPAPLHRVLNFQQHRRPVLLAVCVAVAAAVALLVVAPWKGGPTILQRADAAITAPANQVLYISFGVCCNKNTVYRPTSLWLEEGPPRQFRMSPGGRPFTESGGTLGPATASGAQQVTSYLTYNPRTNILVTHTRGIDGHQPLNFDPLAVVRSALSNGTAKLAGKTNYQGKPAIRIVLTTRGLNGVPGTVVYLADAKTYRPLTIQLKSLEAMQAPFEPLFARHNGWSVTLHITAFKYLPATSQNLALTNIRAEHPAARTMSCNGYRCTPVSKGAKGTAAAQSGKSKHSRSSSIKQTDVPKAALLIRTCMIKQGATSVTPNHPGGYGGVAHFPGIKQPVAWSWVDSNGRIFPVAARLPAIRDRNAPAVRERRAADACLLPYANGGSIP